MIYVAALGANIANDGAHLAMALGEGPACALTYNRKFWAEDEAGNTYGWATFMSEQMTQDPMRTLQRPEWDAEEIIDMEAAAHAQGKMATWLGDPEQPIPQASPDTLTVVAGNDGLSALAAMGLTQVPEDDE